MASEKRNRNWLTAVTLYRYIVDETFKFIVYQPTIFKNIGLSAVKKAALKTHGSHGPSGLDENEWKRIFTCFKEV